MNGNARGIVPIESTRLTAYIDVQGNSLWWAVSAWEDEFSGCLVDFGVWPEQGVNYVELAKIKNTLTAAYPGTGLEGAIYAGLRDVTESIMRPWRREDGSEMDIDRCLIDANWGESTDVVYKFCKESPNSTRISPSHGKFVGASSKPWSELPIKNGERRGLHWRMPPSEKRATRYCLIDVNFWKSFFATRVKTALGDRGCYSFFGRSEKILQVIADHCCSEYRVKTEARGRTVDEWKMRPERGDNHFFDAMVGTAVAASMAGAEIPEQGGSGKTKEKKKRRVIDLGAIGGGR